jgi:hypothetical protein
MNVSYLAGHEQHNLEVFTELLGLTDSEITELMEKKVIYCDSTRLGNGVSFQTRIEEPRWQ